METPSITLQLSSQHYERLRQFANHRQLGLAEIAEVAITEWLERQARLAQGRALMRELGRGLGKGVAGGNVARKHDAYLYRSSKF